MNTLWKLFGYTDEVIRTVLLPMAESANEPTISMGFDAPLAVLSDKLNHFIISSNNNLLK